MEAVLVAEKDKVPEAAVSTPGYMTFGKAAPVALSSDWKADIGVLGVPYDAGASYLPGTRFGPRAIREGSQRLGFFDPDLGFEGYFDPDEGRHFLKGVSAVDCGDADVVLLSVERNFKNIEAAVREVRRHKALPVVLGGDHSITYPELRAFDDEGPLALIHFDAHLDYRDVSKGVKLTHASPIRRCSELPFVTGIMSFGIRQLRVAETDYLAALARTSKVVTYRQYVKGGPDVFEEALPPGEKCFATIDVDCLNAALCPGTGTLEADGLAAWQLVDLLRIVARKYKVVGLDLVEVNPLTDEAKLTPMVAARVLMEFLGAIFA